MTTQISTVAIGQPWKLFPLRWRNIAVGLWPWQYFANFRETISNIDRWRRMAPVAILKYFRHKLVDRAINKLT